MYRELIEFKESTSNEELAFLKAMLQKAHDNIAGRVELKIDPKNPLKMHFEGGEKLWEALDLGQMEAKRSKTFNKCIKTWYWEDEEPDESCDLLVVLYLPVYDGNGNIIPFEPTKR